jgi:hypothetical protein
LTDDPRSPRFSPLKLLSDAREDPPLRFVEHFETGGDAVLRSACRLSLEGIVSKQADAPYQSVRTVPALLAKSAAWQDYCDGQRPLEQAIKRLGKSKHAA